MTASFAPASRRAVKLKIAVEGPSGSGKTLGALALAVGLAEGGRVAVIDTENGSASLYADRYAFDTLEIQPPYLTSKYKDAVQAAIAGEYAVLVIDNISHQWEGDGSVLQRKEEKDKRGGNHWTNWADFTKEHNEFRALLLNAPLHLICTMRSKMAYSQEGEGKGSRIQKLGLQPIQREGMEYEFTLAFDVQMDHKAAASKDRTSLFVGELTDLLNPTTPKRLLQWLKTAKPAEAAAPVVPNQWAGREGDQAETPQPKKKREHAAEADKTRVLNAARDAGLNKETFPAWYQGVTGLAWKYIGADEVDPLLEAAAKLLAKNRADRGKGAPPSGGGTKDAAPTAPVPAGAPSTAARQDEDEPPPY